MVDSRYRFSADGRLCWAYFATPSDEVEQDPELREEMEETLRELYGHLEGSFPDKIIPPGRNSAVDCIRLTLDPIRSEHRPLAFYFVPPRFTLFNLRSFTFFKLLLLLSSDRKDMSTTLTRQRLEVRLSATGTA